VVACETPAANTQQVPLSGNGAVNGKAVFKDFYSKKDVSPQPASGRLRDQRPSLRAIYPKGSVCAVVLGGGENDSRRLFPLTDKRTLPAIPLGGIYRLIDIPLSSLINSGVNKVFVLTQYNSTSLNRYLQHTYEFHKGIPFGGDGFMEVVAATQGPKEQRWAEGPADTVRQWFSMFEGSAQNRFIEDILVLPSDQIYTLDFTQLVDFHRQANADLTIVCRPVEERAVEQVGVVKLDGGSTRIRLFEEKPTGDLKASMSMDFDDLQPFMNESHLNTVPFMEQLPADNKTWVGSCGMYVFRREALARLLRDNPKARDFSRELIPDALKKGMRVMAFNFPDYWVDVGGSIADLYAFEMALARDQLPFSFQQENTFFACPQNLPPTQTLGASLNRVQLGGGCYIHPGTKITSCTIGSRTIIEENCTIEDTVIMGADYYESEKEWPRAVGPAYPHIGIGANSRICKAIIDKNARIGKNVKLLNTEGVYESMDRIGKGICIRDGVTIVSKSAVVPDNTEV